MHIVIAADEICALVPENKPAAVIQSIVCIYAAICIGMDVDIAGVSGHIIHLANDAVSHFVALAAVVDSVAGRINDAAVFPLVIRAAHSVVMFRGTMGGAVAVALCEMVDVFDIAVLYETVVRHIH